MWWRACWASAGKEESLSALEAQIFLRHKVVQLVACRGKLPECIDLIVEIHFILIAGRGRKLAR